MATTTPEHRPPPSELSFAADQDPYNLTPTGSNGRGHRYSSFDTKLFSTYTRDSPTQTKRALEAHLADTDRRIQDASKLGTTLVEQKNKMAARLQEIEAQQPGSRVGVDLRQKLDELEKEYNEVGRETARQVIPRTPRQHNGTMDGGAERTMLSATGRPTPSKPSAPLRKQRNGSSSHVQDIEFATEISTSLLAQVRHLQVMLADKEEELKKANSENSKLQSEAELNALKMRGFDDNEQRYKDDQWHLEVQVQKLVTEIKDAAAREQRLTQSLTTARTHQSAAENEYDELRLLHDKIGQEHESLRRQHDSEVSGMQRSLAAADAEKESLQKKLEELKTQNEDLARAVAYRNRVDQDGETNNSLFEDTMVNLEPSTPDHSPTGSPVKATPRHGGLESETLKSSLHHAHRMIQNLKNNIHREKTEKLDLKRMLQEARDELEARKADGGTSAANAGRKRLPVQQGNFKKPVGPARLGGAKHTQEEIIDDPSWEEYDNSPTRQRPAGNRDVYDLSTDASDAFETAHERDSMATETTEGFQTGLESIPDSADELTETEESHGIRSRDAALARLNGARRDSFESTASDDADAFDFSTPDPKMRPRYKLKVNRGPQTRLYEQEAIQDSPASFTSDGKPVGSRQNLAAELDDLGGENESIAASTPAHSTHSALDSPYSYVPSPQSVIASPQSAIASPQSAIASPQSAIASPQSATASPQSILASLQSNVGSSTFFVRDVSPIQPTRLSPAAAKIDMVDVGTMTEEWQESEDSHQTNTSEAPEMDVSLGEPIVHAEPNSPPTPQLPVSSMSELHKVVASPPQPSTEPTVEEKSIPQPKPLELQLSSIASQYIEPISPKLKLMEKVNAPTHGGRSEPTSKHGGDAVFSTPIRTLSKSVTIGTDEKPTKTSVIYDANDAGSLSSHSNDLSDKQVSRSTEQIVHNAQSSSSETELVSNYSMVPNVSKDAEIGQTTSSPSEDLVNRSAKQSLQTSSTSADVMPATFLRTNNTFVISKSETNAVEHGLYPSDPSRTVVQEYSPPEKAQSSMAFVDMLTNHPITPTTEIVESHLVVDSPTVSISKDRVSDLRDVHNQESSPNANEPIRSAELQNSGDVYKSLPGSAKEFSSQTTNDLIYDLADAPAPLKLWKSESSSAQIPDVENKNEPSIRSSNLESIEACPQKTPSQSDSHQEGTTREPFRAVSGNAPLFGPGINRIRLGDEPTVSAPKDFEDVPAEEAMPDRSRKDVARNVSFEPNTLPTKSTAYSRSESLTMRNGPSDIATYMDPESFGSSHRVEHPPRAQNSQAMPVGTSPPHDRKEATAAASRTSSIRGTMPPPSMSSSSWRSGSNHMSNRTPSGASSQSPIKGGTTPRNRAPSPGRREDPSHASLSSFVSEIDDKFTSNMPKDRSPSAVQGFEMNANTDPRMIQAITQTMIGEHLWKYTRKTGRTEHSDNRHRRFFWIHPYTRMLYWSDQDPSRAGKSELKAKSVLIEAVRVVSDDNTVPPGLHQKSIIVVTPGRNIKFTAPTSQRHETWFNALSYLLLRNTSSGRRADLETANEQQQQQGSVTTRSTSSNGNHQRSNTLSSIPSINSDDLTDFQPGGSSSRDTTASRRSQPATSTSTTRSTPAGTAGKNNSPENAFPTSEQTATSRPETAAGQASNISAIDDEGFKKPEVPSSAAAKDSGRSNSMRGRLGSLTSRISNPFARATSKSRTRESASTEGAHGVETQPQRPQTAESGAGEGAAEMPPKPMLENVRACCDGKHDVSSLDHHAPRSAAAAATTRISSVGGVNGGGGGGVSGVNGVGIAGSLRERGAAGGAGTLRRDVR